MNSNINNYPKISIVTPNFNGAKYLEQTILSVLNQNYPNLEYIIIDGGSTDGSVEIIKKYQNKLTYWESEKDKGQYFAIQKGFEKSTGEIMAWLNSDDMYHPNAFVQIAKVFSDNDQVLWLEGANTIWDKESFCYIPTNCIAARHPILFYFKYHNQFLQQESTFWKRELWEKAGAFINTKYSLAGDFELWMRFFLHAELYQTNFLVGGFRYLPGEQRSSIHFDKYLLEVEQICHDYKYIYMKSLNKIIKFKKILRFISFTRIFNIVALKMRLEMLIFKEVKKNHIINYDFQQCKFETLLHGNYKDYQFENILINGSINKIYID